MQVVTKQNLSDFTEKLLENDKEVKTSLETVVSENAANIEKINKYLSCEVIDTPTFSVIENRMVGTGHYPTDSNGYHITSNILVEGYDKVRVNFAYSNQYVYAVHFYKSEVAEQALTDGSAVTAVTKGQEIDIPPLAKSMILSAKSTVDFSSVELIKQGSDIATSIAEIRSDISKLENKPSGVINTKIVIGDSLYAVVGDTIQVYYDSIINTDCAQPIVKFQCSKGKNFPRYWEFTPTSSDVGTFNINIELYNIIGDKLGEKTVKLNVKEAVNPSSAKNILCVGDSTMFQGQIPVEASRRIKGTASMSATSDSPTALSLTNYNFVGRKQNPSNTVGWEGTGGWTYGTYISSGVTAIRLQVTGATNLNIGDIYKNGTISMEIAEINVTSGTGEIRCTTSSSSSTISSSLPSSGTITKYSGNGQDTITYSSYTVETYQPFWNNTTNSFDMTTYVNAYCGGQLDAICVLLGVNSLVTADVFGDLSASLDACKTFLQNVHAELPNCTIFVSTVPLISTEGGIGSNYGSGSNSGMYSQKGFNTKVHRFNEGLIEIGADNNYKNYVKVISTHAQFDAKYGYPTTNKKVGTRYTETESIQTNALHPRNEGYWQISDALAFRPVLCLL